MTALAVFIVLWTPVSVLAVYSLPESLGTEGRLGLCLIVWLIGVLLGFYYLVARKWR